MMNGLKVAVIMVNWNSEKDMEQSLEALRNQTVKPYRIVVIDNGSRDFDIYNWSMRYPEIEFKALKENIGFAAASNKGASMAYGCDWLAFLNPDAFPESDWIEKLINAIKLYPEFNFFASFMISAKEPDIIDGTGEIYHSSGMAWRRDHQSKLSKYKGCRQEVFGACAAAGLFSKQVFMNAGGFDESYFCYFEDVDLSFRLRLQGGRCLLVPEARVKHVGNGSTKRWSDFAVYHGHRNMVFTYIKNMPTVLFWYFLPQFLIINLIALFWCARREQGRVAIHAKWNAIKRIRAVLKARKNIQKKRTVTIASFMQMLDRGIPLHPHLSGRR